MFVRCVVYDAPEQLSTVSLAIMICDLAAQINQICRVRQRVGTQMCLPTPAPTGRMGRVCETGDDAASFSLLERHWR